MTKNWDRAAMRFASARYVDRQGMLDVTFANGDHFLLATESILPGVGHSPFRDGFNKVSGTVLLGFQTPF